jgi:hypothetical protein
VLGGNRVYGAYLADVGYFVFVEDDLLQGKGDSKEWRECFLDVVSVFPALFAFVGPPHGIALLSSHDGLLEHLVQDVVIFDANGGRSLDEGEDDLKGGDLSLIHEFDQLEGRSILDDLLGLGGNALEIRLQFVVFAGDALVKLISDDFCLSVGLLVLI